MANYISRENVVEAVNKAIKIYGYDGRFYLNFMPFYYEWHAVYFIQFKYLKVKDIVHFENDEISHFNVCNSVIEKIFKPLKDINNQFKYYFNAIWC